MSIPSCLIPPCSIINEMKRILLLLGCMLCLGCSPQRQKDAAAADKTTQDDALGAAHPKLLRLRRLPWGTHIDTLDLSNDGLHEIPSLSMYFIKHINLAHNLIDSINVHRLPNGLHSIDLSYNRLKGRIDYWDASIHQQLRSINLSHNRITMFLTNAGSDWTLLDLSHNDLQCYCPPTEYHCHPPLRVDLSHNPRCSHLVLPWYRNIGTSLRRTRFVRNGTKGEHLPLRLAPREASEKEWRKGTIRLISPLIEIIN